MNRLLDAAESRIGTFRPLAWTSLGVGLAAAAGGTSLLVLSGDDDRHSTAFACDSTGCAGSVRGRL